MDVDFLKNDFEANLRKMLNVLLHALPLDGQVLSSGQVVSNFIS